MWERRLMSGGEATFSQTDRIATLAIDAAGPERSDVIGQERRVAEFELLERNATRRVDGTAGPYDARIARDDAGGWELSLIGPDGGAATAALDGDALRAAAADYAAVCEAYVTAVRDLAPSQIAQLDAERRSAHLRGASLARAAMADAVAVDDETAKRLFSLFVAVVSGER